MNGEKVTIPELSPLGLVEYVEVVELTNDSLNISTNKEDYMFLIDVASISGIHIIKQTVLGKAGRRNT